ncbi:MULTISPECIES: NAD(P)H-binding protein [Acinetobacter]|uniref:Nucleoside-diphosphate sugar epimerase n=2 Tax=Acinetobacter haemolyticus TaxID=29430 RepID=A0A3Q8XJG0_ACIHA|nr:MULTISPECIES: NAD(P)H-binding protein [Acinetobacter]AZN68885.1 nucleoside-diphosphate sugar epimerase [Acinetobacter haemolyticus]EEH68544.1 semialdehyde dehydrogenase, NAD binding domain protein [Acinetobacter sp. ATCC 27244]EFF82298.1 semialdehyde dehydrogenase, NAD binding domain protein [Acinetobacter haemolyticus ATCC 19194]MEB6677614.1 NAD(P)H-binding protein [Acinetobacter haemolyticus]NAR60441.1 NAD(P)H-binding protein [Acinetobacter haemolyticus]
MSKADKKAIIIGATGLVGQALVSELQQSDSFETITVVVRKKLDTLDSYSKVNQLVIEDFLLLNDEDVNTYTHAFSCLGSTIKKAGSKEAFYAIDYEINAHFADLIQDKNIHFLIVSALGANANSPVFYNKVKGELEDYLKSLSIFKLSIFQPSLLIGKRSDVRLLEDMAQTAFKLIEKKWTKPFKFKPVTAEQLAHTMVVAAQTQSAAFKLYDNLAIQQTQ